MKKNKIWQLVGFLVSVCLLVGIDQFTKYIAEMKLKGNSPFVIIKGVLEFSYLRNNGAAWGIMSGGKSILVIFTFIVLGVLLYVVVRTPSNKRYLPFRCFLILLCSGACGNLIDRIVNGYVNDFIYFKLIDFPIFNVSDMYVTVSMFVLVILILFVYKENEFDFLSFKKLKKDMGINGEN